MESMNAAKNSADKRDFFIRLERDNEYEDHGRDAHGDGIHLTLAECHRWLKANAIDGIVEANDGGKAFTARIVHWA